MDRNTLSDWTYKSDALQYVWVSNGYVYAGWLGKIGQVPTTPEGWVRLLDKLMKTYDEDVIELQTKCKTKYHGRKKKGGKKHGKTKTS
jgi:hypothetical protein